MNLRTKELLNGEIPIPDKTEEQIETAKVFTSENMEFGEEETETAEIKIDKTGEIAVLNKKIETSLDENGRAIVKFGKETISLV